MDTSCLRAGRFRLKAGMTKAVRFLYTRTEVRYSKILLIKLLQHLVLLELGDILVHLLVEFRIMDAVDPPAPPEVELPIRLLLVMRYLVRDHRKDAAVLLRLLELLRVYVHDHQFRPEVGISQRVRLHVAVSRAHRLGLESIALHPEAPARVLEYLLADFFVGHNYD